MLFVFKLINFNPSTLLRRISLNLMKVNLTVKKYIFTTLKPPCGPLKVFRIISTVIKSLMHYTEGDLSVL